MLIPYRSLEAFVRAKYEHKKYIAQEWVPPPMPKPAVFILKLILLFWNQVILFHSLNWKRTNINRTAAQRPKKDETKSHLDDLLTIGNLLHFKLIMGAYNSKFLLL